LIFPNESLIIDMYDVKRFSHKFLISKKQL